MRRRRPEAFWAGPFIAEVSDAKFEKCTCLGVLVENGAAENPFFDVGFRELNTNQFSGINFVP